MAGQDDEFSNPVKDDDDPNWFNLPDEPDQEESSYFEEEAGQEEFPNEVVIEDDLQLSGKVDQAAAEDMARWGAVPRVNPNGQKDRRPKRHKRQPDAVRRRENLQSLAPKTIEVVEGQADNADELLVEFELMEILAEAAVTAKNRAEACHLVAAMVPLAAQLASRYRYEIWPELPVLIQGAAGVAEVIHAEAVARPLIRLMPAILQHTVRHLAKYAAQGRPITRQVAADVLAEYTGVIIERHQRANR